jgi:protein gp37
MSVIQHDKSVSRWDPSIRLEAPLTCRKARQVEVTSDLFHQDVPDEFIARVFATMAAAPRHTFLILTKRPGRMASLLADEAFPGEVAGHLFALAVGDDSRVDDAVLEQASNPWKQWPLPNVWLGVSVESQRWAEVRTPKLLACPATVRFLSIEPLLGPVRLRSWLVQTACDKCTQGVMDATNDHLHGRCRHRCHPRHRIGWVIVGGESGPKARPMHPQWARELRDECQAAGVAFFFKQWGEWAPAGSLYDTTHTRLLGPDGQLHGAPWTGWARERPELEPVRRLGRKRAGRQLDGRTWDEFPAVQTGRPRVGSPGGEWAR